MEWDSKMALWELPELEQNGGEAHLSLDCSVDLKLGGLGDLGLIETWKEQKRASTAGSSKRQRAPSISQSVLCLVDHCKSDLSSCKEYHRRHKVCELHSKTPVVMIGGLEQRFCQQCSRFQLLVEFDEVKRSCRKRLDGHNRRRRKPQAEAVNTGNLFLNQHGSRFTSYPQNFPTAATDTWTSIVKTEEDTLYPLLPPPTTHFLDSVQHPPSNHLATTFSLSYNKGKQFFLQHSGDIAHINRTTIEPSAVCQPLFTISAGESSSKKMFSDSLPGVLDSDCALSLLSSSTQTSGVNLGNMVPANRIPMGQPLLSNLHYGVSLGGHSRFQTPSSNVSATGFSFSAVDGEADVHSQSMFQVVDEDASDSASESLHFSW